MQVDYHELCTGTSILVCYVFNCRASQHRIRGMHYNKLQCTTKAVPILMRVHYHHHPLHGDNDVYGVASSWRTLEYDDVTLQVSAKASSVRKCSGIPREKLPFLLPCVPCSCLRISSNRA